MTKKHRPYINNVVDLGGFVLQRAQRQSAGECNHSKIIVNEGDATVTCEDCNKQLDAFWALNQTVQRISNWEERIDIKTQNLKNLEASTLGLKAAKNVEKILRSRNYAPHCPHCSEELTTHDFLTLPQRPKNTLKQ